MTNEHNGKVELLSICIPTFNRSKYLSQILTAIGEQLARKPSLKGEIAVYISDNASPDDTPAVARQAKDFIPRLEFVRNAENIGAEKNFLSVLGMARGEYKWLLGDDELLHDHGLEVIVENLKNTPCGLLVLFDSNYDAILPRPAVFPTYRDFAKQCVKFNSHALVEHSLISSNVVRADCFDRAAAEASYGKIYPHMYGMIGPLMAKGLGVVVPASPVIAVRTSGRPAATGGHPVIDEAWWRYLNWLKVELDLSELDPREPSVLARKLMLRKIYRNPFLFFWSNRRALLDLSAYRHFIHRLSMRNAKASSS